MTDQPTTPGTIPLPTTSGTGGPPDEEPMGWWEVQGFLSEKAFEGRASWSSGRYTVDRVVEYLRRCLEGHEPGGVILVHRGPHVEAADGGIGPWRLVPVDDVVLTAAVRADIATVLAQRIPHHHARPGVWDDDNPSGVAGTRCEECAARRRLQAVVDEGAAPSVDIGPSGGEIYACGNVFAPEVAPADGGPT